MGNTCECSSSWPHRFLLAPDHVLDAERIHARWQWSCKSKNALKLQNLNASLRLMHLMENNQALHAHEELLPHLLAEGRQHKLSLAALDEDAPAGWRHLRAQAERKTTHTLKNKCLFYILFL